ncbi:MAG: CHAT domain-containing protein, partial [Acidobacteriota bacterium]|nr:CHAT domain-containing protein [Acidobacteriota bacterium]
YELKQLSLVTATGGWFRLRVGLHAEPASSSPGTRYRLKVVAMRHATSTDALRVEAQRAAGEGCRICGRPEAGRECLAALEWAAALWRQAGDPEGETDTLNDLGVAYSSHGDTRMAVATYELALSRARQSGYGPGEAWALSNLGSVLHNRGHADDRAVLADSNSLGLWHRSGQEGEEATPLFQLGRVYLDHDEADRALATFERALPLAVGARDDLTRVNLLSGIGNIHLGQGELDDAVRSLNEARELGRAMGTASDLAEIDSSLATVYRRRGQLQMALGMLNEAIRLGAAGSLPEFENNLGLAYVELGQIGRALEQFQKALASSRTYGNWDEQIRALEGLGWVHLRCRQEEAALRAYREAESLRAKATPGISHQLLYFAGMATRSLGRADKALEPLCLAARELGLTDSISGGSPSPARGACLPGSRQPLDSTLAGAVAIATGLAYRDLGKQTEADRWLTRAVDLGRDYRYPTLAVRARLWRARLARDRGDLQKASDDIAAALPTIESTRGKVLDEGLQIGFFAANRDYYELAIDLLLQLDRQRHGNDRAAALALSEKARARSLLDLLARAAQGSDAESPARHPAKNEEPHEAVPGEAQPLELRAIEALLDDRTALLEYALGTESSALFVITRRHLEAYSLPNSQEIEHEVQNLRRSLSAPHSQAASYGAQAYRLYRLLVAPAAAVLADKNRLLIAPDQSLHTLPFEALLTAEAGGRPYGDLPYLLRDKAIAYVPSASVLAASLGRPRPAPPAAASGPQFVAFADPDYRMTAAAAAGCSSAKAGDSLPVELPQLHASKDEVEGIAGLFPAGATRLYMRGRARKRSVGSLLGAEVRYVHFAVHGHLDDRRPEQSALVLSRDPATGCFDRLLVQDILRLKLRSDLVVLSACRTGLGRAVKGEGLLGLSRAFIHAGVRSLVVSLWDIDDESTSGLMVRFYKELGQSHDKAAALRGAKLETIRQGAFADPYYWAPFILIGEPR